MSVLRVNKVTNGAGTGPVEFTKGVIYPVGVEIPNDEMVINSTGIMTAPSLNTTNTFVVGVMTATTFLGNGFQLTSVPGTPSGKVIALHLIS